MSRKQGMFSMTKESDTSPLNEPDLGEKRFAVYVRGLPLPKLTNGWLYLYQGFWSGKTATALENPRFLLNLERATDWCNAIREFDPGVETTIYELVPRRM